MGANLSNNLEGAEVLLSKLLGRSSSLEELHFYKCEIPFRIPGHHSDVSQLRPGTRIEQFYGMNREVRVVPCVCEER